jgi:hypothetical protein
MKKYIVFLILVVAFVSCSLEVPQEILLYETQQYGYVGFGYCCKVSGNTCYQQTQGFVSYLDAMLRTYIN